MGFGARVRDAVLKLGLSINIPFTWTGYRVGHYNFFSDDEIVGLDKELVAMLDWARGRAAVPFKITCGLRTKDQNKTSGGVSDSAHLRGLGVDLDCSDSWHRYKMVQALLLAGFNRLGLYDRHIHADRDPSLPQGVIWTGESH